VDAPGGIDLTTGDPDPALLPPLGPALTILSSQAHLYADSHDFRSLTTFAAAEFDADKVDARFMTVVSGRP
jgi:hypothetical protein